MDSSMKNIPILEPLWMLATRENTFFQFGLAKWVLTCQFPAEPQRMEACKREPEDMQNGNRERKKM
jgi:hypothetical protein